MRFIKTYERIDNKLRASGPVVCHYCGDEIKKGEQNLREEYKSIDKTLKTVCIRACQYCHYIAPSVDSIVEFEV